MAQSNGKRLDGWKAIAEYLGKDSSTVNRWARGRGMPIHRLPGGKGATVYAYARELDAWLESSGNANLATTRDGDAQPIKMGRQPALSRRYGLLFGLVLLLACIAVFLLASRRPRLATQISFSGNRLLALDEQGQLVWEYDFNRSVEKASVDSVQKPRFVDLDGDGRPELVVAAAVYDETGRDIAGEKLYSFSPTGRLLWSYEPRLKMSFGGRTFEGPWRIMDILEPSADNKKLVWLSVAHHKWWPSFLVKLEPTGQSSMQFVDSGVMYALARVRDNAGAFVLAGGVNNEYSAGMLAIIEESQPPGTSPQTPRSPYACDNCPQGHAHRYFVFPRSELNLLEGLPYNPVRSVRVSESQIEILCDEVSPAAAELLFRMTTDFDLTSVAMSDGYAELHRRLSQQGKITHSLRDCPALKQPYTVRMWDAEHGWSQIAVPWAQGQR